MQTPDQSTPAAPEALPPGVRYVRFEYPTSIVFATVRRQSRVFATTSRADRLLRGVGYTFLALALGPWGVPWGLYWTARAVWVNLSGGVDAAGDERDETLRSSGT